MTSDLHTYSKSELISLLSTERKAAQEHLVQVAELQASLSKKDQIIAQLQRMMFGQKRERFEGDPAQGALPFEGEPEAKTAAREQQHEKKIAGYVRKKQSRENHTGRMALPDHLPVEEIKIHPEGDLSAMVCIGTEITEELEMEPARLYIKRFIRYKYAPKNADGVLIGELPARVIEKGIPGPKLLAAILVDKYVDHLPLYRQRQRFLRENIPIASSTLEGWAAKGMDILEILYDRLVAETKSQGYLQADETPIRVLEKAKKGSCHQGYYWVYHNPINRMVLFDYQPTRGKAGPGRILDGFTGYLQTDGYGVYDKIGARKEITHLSCWVHARREFDKAQGNDAERAQTALGYIQELYKVEEKAREQKLTPAGRKDLRLEKSLPVINAFGKWISGEFKHVLPKSQIGKAMLYSHSRWDKLSTYLYDGHLEIDNNLIENQIRPVALGRKNYLFAGSHKAAQRAAIIYSLMAACKIHQVNPHTWLTYVFENIMTTKYNDVPTLYPQNFKANM